MKWLRRLFSRRRVYDDLSEEIQEHLDERIEELVSDGVPRSEANAAARRQFGNVTLIKEDSREAWRWPSVEDFLMDLRYALRMLRKSPGFATVAVLTLALGIGVNTAIFSIVESVLLRPLPFHDSDRLFAVWTKAKEHGADRAGTSMPEFEDYQSQSHSFEYLANLLPSFHYTWTGNGEPRVVRCSGISYDFFPMLGIKPLLGRLYTPQEYHVDGVQVVISHRFWKNVLGGDPQVIGRFLNLDNTGGMTVIGVMPPLPEWFPDTDIWAKNVPDFDWMRLRGNKLLTVIGRLKPGVTRDQAEQELTTILHRGPGESPEVSTELVPLKDQIVGNARTGIEIVMAAVGLVLLIALVNVAYLLLERCSKRQTEIALRLSLGAPRSRIVRQFITENLVLTSLGGALGLTLAVSIVRLFTHLNIGKLPRGEMIGTDSHVLAFALVVTLLTSLLLAWALSLACSKLDLNATLKTGRGDAGERGGRRFRLLLVSEVSLAIVLVVGAGLLVRSFWEVERVDPGFTPDHLMTAFLRTNYYSREGAVFYNQVMERIAGLPGIQATAVSSCLPAAQAGQVTLVFGDRPNDPSGAPIVEECWISTDYFRTIGTPLLQGRTFTIRDAADTPAVAIVNEELARRYWPEQNPIGKRLAINNYLASAHPAVTPRFREVVGVVGNVRQRSVELPTEPTLYTPFLQDETNRVFVYMNLFVRTTDDPRWLAGSMREAVHAVQPDQPIEALQTMGNLMSQSLTSRRFTLLLVGSFAALALILAVIGIYGMIAYSVSQRTREMGLRMALGASPGDVLRLVLSQGLKLVSVGLLIGVLTALAITRFMSSLLFGVTATDPITFVSVAILLTLVALTACYIPARRAMSVDPMVALRHE
jgi:putative ABC transport system permease protein